MNEERVTAMRILNESIAGSATSSENDSRGHWTWEFHCECGEPGCEAWVMLDLAGYEAARASARGIVAEGHAVSRTHRARSRSRELREDSRALGAEAKQQVNRAKRRADV